MVVIIHGITGSDNHSAIVGAVEAEHSGTVRQALKSYFRHYGHGPLNRVRFSEFVAHSELPIVPVIGIDYDTV